jgi:hypothetical protein
MPVSAGARSQRQKTIICVDGQDFVSKQQSVTAQFLDRAHDERVVPIHELADIPITSPRGLPREPPRQFAPNLGAGLRDGLPPDAGIVKYLGVKPRGFTVLTARPKTGRVVAGEFNSPRPPLSGRLEVTPERPVRP